MKLNSWLTSLAWRISLLFALVAFFALFSRQALPAAASAAAYVRLIQASPDAGTVDIFVDGTRFLSNFSFATVTDYKQLPPGPHKVQAALIGKGPGAPAITFTLTAQAGQAYTVAAIGTKATGLVLEYFVDDNHLTSDTAELRVYHLAPGIGAVSVTSGGKTLLSGLGYEHASNYLTLPASSSTFTVTASQPTITSAVVADLKPNRVTSLLALSTSSKNPKLRLVIAQVKGLPALSRTGSDPYARIAPSHPLPLLILGVVGVLVLEGMSAGLAVRRLLAARQPKRVHLTSSRTPGRLYLQREEQHRGAKRGHRVVSKNISALGMLCVLLSGLALLASLALPGCGQQSSTTNRLLIPAIGVNAAIEPIGVLPDGTLAVPTQDTWNDVGWYSGGPRPGEQGSAVINGHLDRPGGSPAVFWNLHKLHNGDQVIVVDAQGKMLHFHVTSIRFYALQEAPVQDIFGNTAGRFLNLTTCAGAWIPSEHQTNMRLVVFTTLDEH